MFDTVNSEPILNGWLEMCGSFSGRTLGRNGRGQLAPYRYLTYKAGLKMPSIVYQRQA
jgi:hypothetical protein